MSEDNKNLEESESISDNMIKENETVMEEAKKTITELNERLQRALADYQNLERRTQVEISQRVADKTNNLLLNFINIYEDFIRAVDVLSKDNVDTKGLHVIIKNMESLLDDNHIKPINAVGEIFDPQKHEAVSMIEDDSLDDGTITQEISKGYLTEKGILKPSKVIVSKKK
tara:strand:- start:414 stop:926 length:513 start_codon:yes stop_codon:yes gene_type:complete